MATITDNGNHQNCTFVDKQLKRYFLPVTYSLIFIVGLVGNVTSIGVYLTKLRPWKSSSIIMVNLALTDLLYVLSMPFLVYYYSWESWTLGEFMCRLVRFGFHFNLYGSILFLTCHAVFRFVVVTRPLKAAQVQQPCWGIVACSFVWIITAAEIAPMLNIIKVDELDNKTYCMDFASAIGKSSELHWYSWLLTTLGFLLPLVVVFICYIGIVMKLAEGPGASTSSRMRARRVTVLILVVFVVCFLPYHILRVLRIESQHKTLCIYEKVIHAAYIISRPLAGLNTCFNLALYTLSGDKFKGAFLSTFHWTGWQTKARSLLHKAFISRAGTDTAAV
ncbi:2-oxoglutarate receptor 1-like [Platichthys flesus]|uniref:2-oxoglutarate receptor 1-like n=1 Tax=Platichthys flesus TaxID=8260 RepID=UPI002DB93649|nr:2-oxoglutarate receptor 1-like [Platichthys flesus]